MDPIAEGRRRWQARWTAAERSGRLPDPERTTLSGIPLDPVYGPQDAPPDPAVDGDGVGVGVGVGVGEGDGDGDAGDFARIGWPGEYPFTRGLYATGYRGKPWTIRQFAGFGSAADTNARYRMILDQGGTGLSVAFDMPTLMGRDSDEDLAAGEVGHCGVAIDSVADLQTLFAGIDLTGVSTSMTISGPAVPVFAMYLVAAERQHPGVDPAQVHRRLNGTLQTDIYKEYIAQKEWLFPPSPHLRLIGDLMEFCDRGAGDGGTGMPDYKPLSVSGYHIREAGSTAAQELAFTLADGFAYVELGLSRGLDVNAFAPGLSFFFDAHIDFFEEIAKFRAARRIWARHLRDVYGATDPRAQWLRFHTQTAGVSLTAQQPENNIVRTAIEAMAAVLGSTNSLHTNALDEVLALPSERAAQIALRTQQVIMAESGVAAVADPLGGSWYVEALTDRLEAEAEAIFDRIADMARQAVPSGDHAIGPVTSGILRGIEDGWFTGEIADAAYAHSLAVDKGARQMVGVNCFTGGVGEDLEILRIPASVETEQCRALADRRAVRDAAAVDRALVDLTTAARGTANLVPPLLAAARAEATLGEICQVLREVFGEYREPARI